MSATHIAKLELPDLPQAACTAHIFPALGTTLLLLVGQLFDAKCMTTFTDKTVTITHNNKMILSGKCISKTNLWNVNLPTTAEHTKDKVIEQHDTTSSAYNVNQSNRTADLVAFVHTAFFSPVQTMLSQALHKNYVNHFPGLMVQSLCNHPKSLASIKGTSTKAGRIKGQPSQQ